MSFTPWTLLIDVGIISVLLLLGKLLRSKVRLIQRFFIPPSLLAGLLGLVLGPELLGWLPLSDKMGTYAGILIALVFSCIPLTSEGKRINDGSSRIGRMWAYSQAGMLLQWALGGAFGIWVLSQFWPVNPAMGLSMPAGFCGGHGTAAAIGESFAAYGVEEMQSLAMTAATVGIIASVVIGM
ncbi:MAG: sodium:glutamate symporter, partial [Bacteroidales bacterium]|nr:sodium:glutamate symporter [Bacteroidales bacterium]